MQTATQNQSQARTLEISGMSGDACVKKVTNALKEVSGVETQSVKVGSATIKADKTACDAACAAIKAAGYTVREGEQAGGMNANDSKAGQQGKQQNSGQNSGQSGGQGQQGQGQSQQSQGQQGQSQQTQGQQTQGQGQQGQGQQGQNQGQNQGKGQQTMPNEAEKSGKGGQVGRAEQDLPHVVTPGTASKPMMK